MPSVRGEDRDVLGGSLVIHRNEVVHTVTVTGGSLKVEGTVTGDLVVLGGSAKIGSHGRVVGNAEVFGGSLKVERHGRIDGKVALAGGSLRRERGAIIGGSVSEEPHERPVRGIEDGNEADATPAEPPPPLRSRLSVAAREFGRAMAKVSLLFVLGCVLLALLAPPMERVRREIAIRPMRAFALGIVGSVVAVVAATVAVTLLCITVIGIPVAMVGVLLAVVALYGAIAAVLTTVGAAVSGHRTQSPYVHLVIGCAAFLLLSSIPWVGGVVTFVVAMVAVGALIATRVGGMLTRRRTATGLV
jgi:hypothetical protein